MAEAITAIQRHSSMPSCWQWGAQRGKSISHPWRELKTVNGRTLFFPSPHHCLPCSCFSYISSHEMIISRALCSESIYCNGSGLVCVMSVFLPPFQSSVLPEHLLYPPPVSMTMDSDLAFLSFPFLSRSSYSICVDISRQNHKFDWCIRRIFFYSRPTFSGQMKISGDKNSGIRSTFFCMCVRSCFAWVLALCIINNISDANTWNHNRKRICCSSMLEQASPSLITCYPLILITLPFSLLSRLSISFPSQSVPTAQAEFLLMLMDNLSLDSAIEIWRAHWWRETFPWLLPAWLTTNWYFRCPELWPTLLCITQKERIRHFWSWYTTMISCGSKEEMLS